MWNRLRDKYLKSRCGERAALLPSILLVVLLIASTPITAQVLSASADVTTSAAASVKRDLPVNDYIIGPEDVLAVNVWKEPEVSRTLPVRPDGKISLPLIGDLLASGRTTSQLQGEIKQQLRTYFTSPEVTVLVQEAKSHKFNIVGEVTKPGSYVMSNSMTVLDAIAVAGGLKDFAKSSKIYVLRVSADGSHVRLPFNYKKVIKGGDLKDNVELVPRDTIVVP